MNTQKALKRALATLVAIVEDSGINPHEPRPKMCGLAEGLGWDAWTTLEEIEGKYNATLWCGAWIACFGDYDEGKKFGSGDTRSKAFTDLMEAYL